MRGEHTGRSCPLALERGTINSLVILNEDSFLLGGGRGLKMQTDTEMWGRLLVKTGRYKIVA